MTVLNFYIIYILTEVIFFIKGNLNNLDLFPRPRMMKCELPKQNPGL